MSFNGRATLTKAVLLVPCAVLVPASGCEFIGDLEDTGGIVDVFTAHHGTPQMTGEFPDHGEPGMPRSFVNDEGWTVALAEAYLTTAGVELAGCNGGVKRVDLFWGPSAENLVEISDAEPRGIGGVRTAEDKFCQARITYGPYSFAAAEEGAEYSPPGNNLMDGQTILLAGYATKGEDTVGFEFISDVELAVVRDISTVQNGRPLTVKSDQSFPAKIVLAKTYDRFFEGVDFLDYTDDDIQTAVVEALERDSRVIFDVKVDAPSPAPE